MKNQKLLHSIKGNIEYFLLITEQLFCGTQHHNLQFNFLNFIKGPIKGLADWGSANSSTSLTLVCIFQ